jgi:DNA-binding NarL/FixJ family response regulator
MNPAKIRVLLYDDNESLRSSIVTMMTWNEAFEVIAAFPDGRNILEHIHQYSPDVILMDIDMPPSNGIDTLKVLRTEFPDIPVIMLTVFEDNDHILQAICAGASGYLLKKDIDQVVPAIKDVLSGGAPMTSTVARKVLQLFPQRPVVSEENSDGLTPREKEILQFLVKGFSYKMIASELNLSVDTIRTHIKKIYKKMHVSSATEAVYKVTQQRY